MRESSQIRNVAMVGCGAIGSMIADAISTGRLPGIRLTGIAVRRRSDRAQALADRANCVLVGNPANLVETKPEAVVEAASQKAVGAYGPVVLDAGLDLLVASVGGLAGDDFRSRLIAQAKNRGCRILIPSGAVGGLDALQAAAAQGGLDDVLIVTRKHPRAFPDQPDLQSRSPTNRSPSEPMVLFRGTAREAVAAYPKSMNVAAAVSLAGIGFDRTRVEVIADPSTDRTRHEIFARGPLCNLTFRFENSPHPDNPSTSMLAAVSVLSAIANLNAVIVVGA